MGYYSPEWSVEVCGVAAMIAPKSKPSELNSRVARLFKMLEAQMSRGPDDQGIYHKFGVFLGHNLLKIMDCDLSTQPMDSVHGGMCIAFNGEIYNFQELRSLVENEGIELHTRTDTEVILELYRIKGLEMIPMLRGMFSFIIHDFTKKKVIVARDRFGQKPLYIRRVGSELHLASTIKALTAATSGGLSVDEESLYHCQWMLMPPKDATLIKGVSLVPAGAVLSIDQETLEISERRYSSPKFSGHSQLDVGAASEELRNRLRSAVREQIDGREQIAAHLSGGLDSSAITSLAVDCGVKSISTFSCSYQMDRSPIWEDESAFEEAKFSSMVARHLSVPNSIVSVGADDYFFDLVDLVETLDDPRGNPCVPHLQLARAIGDKHKVVMSGEGADEVFGGYPWKTQLAFDVDGASKYWQKLVPAAPETLSRALSAPYADVSRSREYVLSRISTSNPDEQLNGIMQFDFEHFLSYLLLQADKLAGRFGVEARYPFLDNRVVELGMSLSSVCRSPANGEAKPVLRRAIGDLLPPLVLNRPKVGFVPPEGGWYRGPLAILVREILCAPNAFVSTIYRRDMLVQILVEHRRGYRNYRKLIWFLLTLEIWHSLVIKAVPKADLQDHIQALRFDGRNRTRRRVA